MEKKKNPTSSFISLSSRFRRASDSRCRNPAKMPASAASNRPEDLIGRLSSAESGAKLKALREVKNQIIGNRTKKISYVKLGAVPRIVDILAASEDNAALLIQSAAALGSFACGVDAGVRAVLDSGAYPHLVRLLSNPDPKAIFNLSLRILFFSLYTLICNKSSFLRWICAGNSWKKNGDLGFSIVEWH